MPSTETTFKTPSPVRLEVRITAGDVHVNSTLDPTTTVQIEGSDEQLAALEIRQSGDTITVEQRRQGERPGLLGVIASSLFGGIGDQSRLQITISTPAGADVQLTSASAGLELDGRFGNLKLKSASGGLTAHGEVEGSVSVHNVSGDVTVDTVAGTLTHQTVSGGLSARRVGGDVTVKSVSGDVRLDAIEQGNVQGQSVSGAFALGIAPGTGFDIDANSASGEMRSELELTDTPDGEPGPEAVIRVRTVSGGVRIFRAAADALSV